MSALGQHDAELLLQYLTVPYLRVPLLLRFFAEPTRTMALAHAPLQRVLDAALFEPGEWQPDEPKALPALIPAPNRAHLHTPCGLLLHELSHSPDERSQMPLPEHSFGSPGQRGSSQAAPDHRVIV